MFYSLYCRQCLFIFSRTKFFEFDLKPVCKFCYDKFPAELKKRLKKAFEGQTKK